jgi:YVTN family beta-propeller protein
VYVAHSAGNEVAVIDAATRKVVRRIPVEVAPVGLSLDPAGTRLYVVNSGSDSVCTIDTAAEQVIATVRVGRSPRAYGSFVTTTTGSIAGVIDDVGPRLDAIATVIDGATESSRVKQRLTKLITRAAARLRSAAVGGKRGRRRLAGAERLVDAFVTALERAKRRDKIDEAAADAMSATAHAVRGMIAQARLAAQRN